MSNIGFSQISNMLEKSIVELTLENLSLLTITLALLLADNKGKIMMMLYSPLARVCNACAYYLNSYSRNFKYPGQVTIITCTAVKIIFSIYN